MGPQRHAHQTGTQAEIFANNDKEANSIKESILCVATLLYIIIGHEFIYNTYYSLLISNVINFFSPNDLWVKKYDAFFINIYSYYF